jgi:superfamily I DNA/RNA helicase
VDAGNRALPSAWPLRPRRGAPGGEAPEVIACADPRVEARTLADRVEALLAEGADPREIVVLSRARHLVVPYQEEVVARRADEAWAEDHPTAVADAIDAFLLRNRRTRLALDAWAAQQEGELGRAARILARRARSQALPARPNAARLLALPRGEDVFHVKAMTIHGAKGLEWDHVLLAGAREGGIPSDHALQAPEHVREGLIEEERRLLYVALTRARRSFVATWARQGDRRAHAPCRWLAAIAPPEVPAAVAGEPVRLRA